MLDHHCGLHERLQQKTLTFQEVSMLQAEVSKFRKTSQQKGPHEHVPSQYHDGGQKRENMSSITFNSLYTVLKSNTVHVEHPHINHPISRKSLKLQPIYQQIWTQQQPSYSKRRTAKTAKTQ